MFLSAFVCLLAGLRHNARSIFTKFGGKVAHEPRKKPLDFDDNLARSRYVRDTATVRRGTSCIPCRCVYVNIAGPVKT